MGGRPLAPQMTTEPNLVISDLSIWVHGRERPEDRDYWDGNWLLVTAYYDTDGASVKVHGPVIHLSELADLMFGCEQIYETLKGAASLECMEPELHVNLTADKLGRIDVSVSITPDHLTQYHKFDSQIDQSYLPAIIASLRNILQKYPIRGR